MSRFANKIAVVTGGGRGIGQEIARFLTVRALQRQQNCGVRVGLLSLTSLAGVTWLTLAMAEEMEHSAMPGTPEYMRPVGRFENLPAENSSVLQCYIFPTRAGVIYQVESSHDMAHWTTEGDEIHALGHEQVLTMREFTPPPPGSPPPGPLAPPPIRTSLRLARPADASACTVVSWASLDDKRAVVKVLSQPLENCWQRMPFYWRRYGNHDFSLVTNLSTLPLPSEDPVLGPKDAAMFAQLESSFQDMTQEVIDSIARARNAPPPAPVDPMSRKFFRVRCDWSVDTDADGTPDWMEFEMAGWSAEGPTPPLRADAFVADTNGDGIPDGQQLDYDKVGIPDSQDAGPQDASMAFQITPPPRYALFPITNAQPSEDIPDPLQINDQGTVLYANGIWKAGTWQALADSGPGLDSAQARALNDHDVILGVAKDSNDQGWTCFWPDPAAAPLLVATGEGIRAGMYDLGAAGNGYDLTNNLLSPGPVLSNDGSFFMTANELRGDPPMWEYLRHSKWRLPTYQKPSTTEMASANRGLRYSATPDLSWGQADNNPTLPGIVLAPDPLPGLPFAPTNVVRLPGSRILAMASGVGNGMAQVFYNGTWHNKTTLAHAVDCDSKGTAIGKDIGGMISPIWINGEWTAAERYAPGLPAYWQDSTFKLCDTTPSGWILASRRNTPVEPVENSVLLPIRVEGRSTRLETLPDGTPIIDSKAVGVDDFSIGSYEENPSIKNRIWIMAPANSEGQVIIKSPVNHNTQVAISDITAGIGFPLNPTININSPEFSFSIRASNSSLEKPNGETTPTLQFLQDPSGASSLSKPIGIKSMKSRMVNITVYQIARKLSTSGTPIPPDAAIVPSQDELQKYLTDLFKPQINLSFNVTVLPDPFPVQWDLNGNARLDYGIDEHTAEQGVVLEKTNVDIPSNIKIFLISSADLLGDKGGAYAITNRNGRTCWILGSQIRKCTSKQFVKETIGHELGHVFVGYGHPDSYDADITGPAPLPGTDHACRLMCGGIRLNSGSRLLVKQEWDAADEWLKNEENEGRLP